MTSIDIYSAILVSQSKTCTKCKELKLFKEFSKSKTKNDGLQSKCKSCAKEQSYEYKERAKELREINKEHSKKHTKARNKEYRQENIEYIKERNKEYKQTNKGKINAASAKRKAAKLKAIPKWVELDLIKQLYKDCELISEMTGISHHVDHIVPLQSDIVRGLHCFANLQIITAIENLSKSNLYWPDMP